MKIRKWNDRRLKRTPQHRYTPDPVDHIDHRPHARLAAAILIQAGQDWIKYGEFTDPFLCGANTKDDKERVRMDLVALDNAFKGPREELTTFFSGEMYELLCDIVGINPDTIRHKLGIPE